MILFLDEFICPKSFVDNPLPSTRIDEQQMELIVDRVPFLVWNEGGKNFQSALKSMEVLLTDNDGKTKHYPNLALEEHSDKSEAKVILTSYEKEKQFKLQVKYLMPYSTIVCDFETPLDTHFTRCDNPINESYFDYVKIDKLCDGLPQ